MASYHNKIAEQVFGTIGTICWTAQLIPQVWKSYRSHSTEGLSHWLMLLWGISGALQGVYVLLIRLNIPLMIQPQLFGFLAFVSWGQCQYYTVGRSKKTALLLTIGMMLFWGAFEFIFVIALRPIHDRGNHTAADVFGIVSSVVISVALIPQYWEIWKYKEVIGVSMLFILVDILGGVFNDLSLVFKEDFEVIAAITYSLVIVLDGVIVVAALILNPRARRRRCWEAESGPVPEMSENPSSQTSCMTCRHTERQDDIRSLSERTSRLEHSSDSTSQPPSATSTVVEEAEEGRRYSGGELNGDAGLPDPEKKAKEEVEQSAHYTVKEYDESYERAKECERKTQ